MEKNGIFWEKLHSARTGSLSLVAASSMTRHSE